MESTKEYNGITLIESDAIFLKEMEKILKKEIPCLENRDKVREDIEKKNEERIAQQQAQLQTFQTQAQDPLATKYQQILAMEAQLDQQAAMSQEQLEEMYTNQLLAQLANKAQLQMQLKYMITSLGENHPTVKQYKEMLDMDEGKAKSKAKALAQYYVMFYKLRELYKEQKAEVDKLTYSSSATIDALVGENLKLYKIIITPKYQRLLKETLDLGKTLLGEDDLNLAQLKPTLGLSLEKAEQLAQKTAKQSMQNIKMILNQYGAAYAQQQLNIEELQQSSKTGISDQPIRIGNYLGFISDRNHIVGLNLNSQELINLPDSICNLSKLRVLSLKWNKLESLPDNFGNLKNLEELDLDGTWSTNNDAPLYNEILELPSSFCELNNLKIFKCQENGLRNLPDNLGQLSSLKEAHIHQNNITVIPDSIGNCVNLEVLNLGSNKISKIPPSLCKCKRLHDLRLGFNSISKIPDCIDQLTNLKTLVLSSNNLIEIPLTLTKIQSLDLLWLDTNQLTEIPENISKMNLTNLNLRFNQLNILPYFIWEMVNLRNLEITNNPLSEEELEVAKQDTAAILAYCRQRANIAIMILHTEIDANSYRIPDLIKYLEEKSEIFGVLPPLEANLRATDLILFLATAGSINSPECIRILKNGKDQGIPIVPLKGLDIGWEDLSVVDLSRELGHEYTPDNFNSFCENVYSYIQQLKRAHNIFKDKSKILLKEEEAEVSDIMSFGTFKEELTRIFNNPDLKDFFEKNKMALAQIMGYMNQTGGTGTFLTTLFTMYTQFKQTQDAIKKYGGGFI